MNGYAGVCQVLSLYVRVLVVILNEATYGPAKQGGLAAWPDRAGQEQPRQLVQCLEIGLDRIAFSFTCL